MKQFFDMVEEERIPVYDDGLAIVEALVLLLLLKINP